MRIFETTSSGENKVTAPKSPGSWLGRVISFFQSFKHRDAPLSWADLEHQLNQFDPHELEKLTPIEAANKAKLLRQTFAWHIDQPLDRPVQRELFLTLALLSLIALNDLDARAMEQQALCAPRPLAASHQRAVQRISKLHLCLARLLLERKQKERAQEQVHQAVTSHYLQSDDWKTIVDVLLGCDEDNERSFRVYLEYLTQATDNNNAKLTERLSAALKERMTVAEGTSRIEREGTLLKLRRLHLAAPQLNWPLVRLAEDDLQDNQLVPAERKLECVYPLIDDDLKVHAAFLLGQVAFSQEKYEKADGYFDTALKSGADVASVFEYMGVAKANIGSFQQAINYIDKALGVAADDTYLLLQKANILLCEDRMSEAQEYYERIIELEPGAVDATFGLGKIEESKGNLAQAFALYQQVLSATPSHVPAQFSFGLLCLKQGNEKKAEQWFEQVQACEPKHLPSLLELGILHVRKGIQADTDILTSGIEYLRACEQAGYQDQRLAYWLGRALAENKDYLGCLGYWEPLLAKNQGNIELKFQVEVVRFWMAIDLGIAGETESAVKLLQKLSRAVRETLPVEHLLCRLRLDQAQRALFADETAKCSELLAEVLSMQPENAKAHLLQVMQKLHHGQISKDEILAIANNMADGEEREMCKLLHWLHGRQLDFDLIEDEELWAHVASELLPPPILNDTALCLLDLSYRIMSRRKHRLPIDEPDIERTIQLAGQLPDDKSFSRIELGWWLAKLVLETGHGERYEQLLRAASRDDSPLLLALDLVYLNDKKMDQGAALLAQAIKVENQRLTDFIAQNFCHAALKEIQKSGKDPARINRAHDLLKRAIELV